MEGQRGRRERYRHAGQADRLFFITQAALHMEMKDSVERGTEDRKVKKIVLAVGALAVHICFFFSIHISLHLASGQRLDLKQIKPYLESVGIC